MFFDLSSQNSAMINKILSKQTCVIFYYWNLCGYCQQIKPLWNKIVQKYMNKNNIVIINVEIDNIGLLKAKYRKNINGVPTIIKCNNGKPIYEFKGKRTFKELDDFVKQKIV